MSLTVAVEKLCIVLLVRQVMKSIIWRTTAVTPFSNTYLTATMKQNHKNIKQTSVQHLHTDV
jgi:hypothetical protein